MAGTQISFDNLGVFKTDVLTGIYSKLKYTSVMDRTDNIYEDYCRQERSLGKEPFSKEKVVFLQSQMSIRDDGETVPREKVVAEAQELFAKLKKNNFGKSAVVTQIGFEPRLYVVDDRDKKINSDGKSL